MPTISTMQTIGTSPYTVLASQILDITLAGGLQPGVGSSSIAVLLQQGSTLNNLGQVSANSYAVYMAGMSVVDNTGSIRALDASSVGIQSNAGGIISNDLLADISGGLAGIRITANAASVTANITNYGLIKGATAILVDPAASTPAAITIVNEGELRANASLGTTGPAVNVFAKSVGLTNSGLINGGVVMYGTTLTGFSSVFQNSGIVEGNVRLAGQSATTAHGGAKYIGTGDGVVNGIIYGSAYTDHMTGGNKRDFFYTNGGDDILFGGRGNDKFLSGAGNDRLTGGLGADVMSGGFGSDTFYYNSARESSVSPGIDQIEAFGYGDHINLRALEGRAHFIGAKGFTDTGRFEVRVIGAAGEYKVQADLNGDGRADMIIRVVGTNKPTADDFFL